MDAEETKTQRSPSPEQAGGPLGPSPTARVREIIKLLAQTVSAMKIFPSNHSTVHKFVDDLTDRFKSFLDEHGALEIGIQEQSFTYLGEPVYTDEHVMRSLPFFFHKDGLQMLFFYPGLDRPEIFEFLEIIRRESFRPPDEADIVNALWEREFGSIQYFAPDDFLESRVIKEREEWAQQMHIVESDSIVLSTIEVKIDPEKLRSGRVDLDPADEAPPAAESSTTEIREAEPAQPSEGTPGAGAALRKSALDEKEIDRVEIMIRANRELPPHQEYIDLLIEILFLEDNLPMFHSTAEVVGQHFMDMIQRGEYSQAMMLIDRVRLLRAHFDQAGERVKSARLSEFLNLNQDPRILEMLRVQILEKEVADPDALMDFIKMIGPSIHRFLAEVYEKIEDLGFRRRLLAFFRESAAEDFRTVISLVNEHRPVLTREIVAILVELNNKKAIPFFANFLNFGKRELKLDAIEALGTFEDETANKILLEFMKDPDPDVRTRAALRVHYLGDLARIKQMILLAKSREFRKKNGLEQKAIYTFLSRSQTDEACEFLRSVLLTPSLFSIRITHLRQLAIGALAEMGTEGARQALERGCRVFSPRIRAGCRKVLESEAPPATAEANPPPSEGDGSP
jgi:hypothetical protein